MNYPIPTLYPMPGQMPIAIPRPRIDKIAEKYYRLAKQVERNPRMKSKLSELELIAISIILNEPAWLKRKGLRLPHAILELGRLGLDSVYTATEKFWFGDGE